MDHQRSPTSGMTFSLLGKPFGNRDTHIYRAAVDWTSFILGPDCLVWIPALLLPNCVFSAESLLLSLSFLLCKMGFIFPEKRRGLGIDKAWGTGSKKGDAPESQLETNRTKSLIKRSDGSNSRRRLSTREWLSKYPTGCKAQL